MIMRNRKIKIVQLSIKSVRKGGGIYRGKDSLVNLNHISEDKRRDKIKTTNVTVTSDLGAAGRSVRSDVYTDRRSARALRDDVINGRGDHVSCWCRSVISWLVLLLKVVSMARTRLAGGAVCQTYCLTFAVSPACG